MGKKKLATVEETTPVVTEVAEPIVEAAESETEKTEEQTEKSTKKTETKKTTGRTRSKKYSDARSKIDKTKKYAVETAIDLVKELSYSKFAGSVEAHLQLTEVGASVNITFPHSTGKSVKVEVFSEETLKKLDNNNIDFDVLLATPADMKNLTKYARVLGPKGLMPNPKTGTLTPNPAAKKKELEAGAITLKAERKAPLMHVVIGKTNMETSALAENLRALINALGMKVVRVKIAATMSPSVTVQV